MTLFPEAQKRAQAEIDAVIGLDRLPTLADRDLLPFVDAIIKEVTRWHVVVPLGNVQFSHFCPYVHLKCYGVGFPHSVSEDDIHEGYYIPKGTVVIPNAWYDNFAKRIALD